MSIDKVGAETNTRAQQVSEDDANKDGNTVLQHLASSISSEENGVDEKSDQLLKRAHRKVDKRLVSWYSFVYLIMRIQVSNITNTAIINLEEGTGIKKQLGNLTSQQWAWALSIFYYPYMFFEPVATLALKRFSPSV